MAEPEAKKVRLQIDISPNFNEDLEVVMDKCDISTKKELINTALTVFEWMVKHASNGRVIAAVDEAGDTYIELGMPALDAATRNEEAREKEIAD